MASNPSLRPEIGPDGLAREAPVIAYTEKVSLSLSLTHTHTHFLFVWIFFNFVFVFVWQIIEEEQIQLKKYVHFPNSLTIFCCSIYTK